MQDLVISPSIGTMQSNSRSLRQSVEYLHPINYPSHPNRSYVVPNKNNNDGTYKFATPATSVSWQMAELASRKERSGDENWQQTQSVQPRFVPEQTATLDLIENDSKRHVSLIRVNGDDNNNNNNGVANQPRMGNGWAVTQVITPGSEEQFARVTNAKSSSNSSRLTEKTSGETPSLGSKYSNQHQENKGGTQPGALNYHLKHNSFYEANELEFSDEVTMSDVKKCCFGMWNIIAQVFLHGVMILTLYWVYTYRSKNGDTFAWKSDSIIQFNLHPVLMITGLIYMMGQALLMHQAFLWCGDVCNSLFHMILLIFAIPCVTIGFIAVLDSHNLRVNSDGVPNPIPNFYSLHSWMGLITMLLFALQFLIAMFGFSTKLCYQVTAKSLKPSSVPLHSVLGIVTFVLAVATACTGITEKAFFSLSVAYSKWVPYISDKDFNVSTALTSLGNTDYTESMFEESLIYNVLGISLVLLSILIPAIIYSFQKRISVE